MENKLVDQIQNEIKKVIIGKDEIVEKILMSILAQGHVLLEDVPGVGKTTMALSFAKVLGLDTRRVQFTSDTMPSDIVGFSVYEKNKGDLVYKPGAIMTNLLLADEINRTSSKTQAALLEAMEERRVTVDGVTHPLPEPFVVLATQNPVGSAGTQMLPNTQLDRFLVKLSMGYPDLKSQMEIMKDRHHENPLDKVSAVTSIEKLNGLIAEVRQVHIADEVYEYISRLVEETRQHALIQLGISPRGALALCRAAKARAFIRGRDFVSPEDVQAVVPDVFAHRLALNAKAKLHERTPEQILDEIMESVPAPVLREFKTGRGQKG